MITPYSIIICTFNEGRQLSLTINNIFKTAGYNKFEIIVINDGSSDGSTAFLEKSSFKNVKLINIDHSGASVARNIGAKKAHGKILIFVDAHMRFDRDWLKRIDHLLNKKKQIKILTGSISNYFASLKRNNRYFYLKTNIDIALLRAFFLKIKIKNRLLKVPYTSAAFFVMYKNVFFKLGGFLDIFMWSVEDRFLCMVAYYFGYDIYLDTGLKIYHNQKWSFRNIKTKIEKNALKNSLIACYTLYSNRAFKNAINYLEFIYPSLKNGDAFRFFLNNKVQLNKLKAWLKKNSHRTYNDFVNQYYLYIPCLQINDYRKALSCLKNEPQKAYRLLLQARRLTYTNNVEETAKIVVDIEKKLQKLRKRLIKKNIL